MRHENDKRRFPARKSGAVETRQEERNVNGSKTATPMNDPVSMDNDQWRAAGIKTRNKWGEWVPSIPAPTQGIRMQCSCGRKFWTMEGYTGHYALVHILGLDS